jgi:low affinity Fe/Cu permease
MNNLFRKFSHSVSSFTGRPLAFALAVLLILVWIVTGPLFEYSDTWQLAINTGTTVVTFLMVFLIQSTQNRDTKAINLKLDELIFAIKTARNKIVDVNNLPDDKMEMLETAFENAANKKPTVQ